MYHSKSKKLTRKLLTISFFLFAVVALLISPVERKVRAQERCIDCYPIYVECLSQCDQLPENENCRLRCELDYSVCLWLCDPN
jgi:hypothetical protein